MVFKFQTNFTCIYLKSVKLYVNWKLKYMLRKWRHLNITWKCFLRCARANSLLFSKHAKGILIYYEYFNDNIIMINTVMSIFSTQINLSVQNNFENRDVRVTFHVNNRKYQNYKNYKITKLTTAFSPLSDENYIDIWSHNGIN